MTKAKEGDTVRIHYSGKLTDGTEFDSSEGGAPLEFEIGSGQIIPGLEQQIVGMEPGETNKVTVAAEDAYGPHHPEHVQDIPKESLPADLDVEVGSRLQATTSDGRQVPLTVVEVGDAHIKVDANHPLAGQDLVFDVELVEIV